MHTGEAKKIVCSALPSLFWCGRASANWPPLPDHNRLKRLMPYFASLSRRPHLGPEDGDGEEGGTAVVNAHVHGLAPLLHLQDEVCGLAETKAGVGAFARPRALSLRRGCLLSLLVVHCFPPILFEHLCVLRFSSLSLFLVLLIFVFVLLWIPSQG